MAGRPIKQGIDYFPLNTDFFQDVKVRKIMRACGPNAVSVLICLLCNIYRDNGYYILWDEDLPFFIADEVGVTEGCVKEILLKAVQVGFFDVEKYAAHRILTSSGIQKRFLNITNRRKDTVIKGEFLINADNNSINVCNNSINVCRNSHKVKESKEEKETKVSTKNPTPRFQPPTVEEAAAYISAKGYHVDPEIFVSFYESKGWYVGKNKMKNWHAAIATWEKTEKQRNGNQNRNPYPSKQEANDYALHALQERMERRGSGLQDQLSKPF